MKKFFTMLFVGFFLISQNAFAVFTEEDSYDDFVIDFGEETWMPYDSVDFTDTDYSISYYDAIRWMYLNGVVQGYEDGTFKPDICVNRVEFLKMLYAVLEIEETGYEAALLADIEEGLWYTEFVRAALSRGTVNGYEDNTFRPGQCVLRAEAVKMAVLEFNEGAVPENYFSFMYYDDVSVEQWFFDYVDYAVSVSAVGLEHVSERFFGPADSMSRKEVAELLYRLKVIKDNRLEYYYPWVKPFDIGAVPFYETCNDEGANVSTEGLELTSFLPADTSMVFAVDYADPLLRANFEDFVSQFSDIGLSAFFDGFLNNVDSVDKISSVLADEWGLIFGLKFPEGMDSFYDIGESDDVEIYVAGRAKSSDLLTAFLEDYLWLEYKSDLNCAFADGVLYWTAENDEFYMVKYGDMFLLTNDFWFREKALERLLGEGGGFELFDDAKDAMGYVYMDFERFGGVLGELYGEMGVGYVNRVFEEMENVYAWLNVAGDLLEINSKVELAEGSEMFETYKNYELSIVDKVPFRGIIAYMEDPDFMTMYEAVFENFQDFGFFGGSVTDYLIDFLGVSEDEMEMVIDSPFAFSVSDVGALYPGFVLYFQLEANELEAGKKVADGVAGGFHEMILSLNGEWAGFNLADYLVEVGPNEFTSGLSTMMIDFADFPEEFWDGATLVERELLEDLSLEFYYGVNNDGILVLALYPDFPKYYGKDVLSANAEYRKVVALLGNAYGANVNYLDVGNLIKFADFYVELSGLGADEREFYDKVRAVVSTIDYFAGSSSVEGSAIVGKSVVKVK